MMVAPEIMGLSADYAKEHAGRLLSFTSDQAWENWSAENLLAERPRKWDLSLVLTDQGVACGYAIISQTDAMPHHLHHIAILPSLRGLGLGTMLLDHAMRRAESEGYPMRLKVHKSNQAALRLYQNLGFLEVEDSEEYRTLTKEPNE